MKRRDFLKSAACTAGGFVAVETLADEQSDKAVDKGKNATLAAPCGLYCFACNAYADGTCHGCGCECGKCAGKRAKWCDKPETPGLPSLTLGPASAPKLTLIDRRTTTSSTTPFI